MYTLRGTLGYHAVYPRSTPVLVADKEMEIGGTMLICVCDIAEAMRCSVCPKYKKIKPDATMNYPTWRYKREGKNTGTRSSPLANARKTVDEDK
jgi:hypothetical protein